MDSKADKPFQYQTNNENECLESLLSVLNFNNTCQNFAKKRKRTIPTTHNMVCMIHITTNAKKFDLDVIADCVPNSTYNKRRFATITIRLEEPRTTALLFSSGKLVITGAVSKQMAVSAA